MPKQYKDLSLDEKERINVRLEQYRKKNPQLYRDSALKYYYANKEKCSSRHKLWREQNKDIIRQKQRESKRLRKLWAIDYLGGSCSKCGGTFHPAVYEFHHTDPESKERDPSKMLSLSKERLVSELNKCVLLCANCHRMAHHSWE